MRGYLPALIFVVLLFAVASCGGSNLNKANGTWQCDPQATIALLDDTAKKAAGIVPGLAEGILNNVEFSLDAKNKKVTGSVFGISGSSDFTVVSDSGSSLEIKSGNSTIRLKFRDANSLEVSGGPNAQKFVFKRIK